VTVRMTRTRVITKIDEFADAGSSYSCRMSLAAFAHKHWLNAVTAMLFGIAFWRLGFSPELPAVLAFIFGGALLAVIDWKIQRLPTQIVYYTLAGVGAGLVFASLVTWEWVPLATAAAGGLLFANAFFLLYVITRQFAGMVIIGFGDVRLAAVLGLLLGWYGLPYVLYGAIAGNLLAALVALATCLHRRTLVMRYAFGPPLIAGTLAVVLFHG
jgi:leader peptidase (prepilin peptidase) / N-methyltransferase